jgi:hypothetical protein
VPHLLTLQMRSAEALGAEVASSTWPSARLSPWVRKRFLSNLTRTVVTLGVNERRHRPAGAGVVVTTGLAQASEIASLGGVSGSSSNLARGAVAGIGAGVGLGAGAMAYSGAVLSSFMVVSVWVLVGAAWAPA